MPLRPGCILQLVLARQQQRPGCHCLPPSGWIKEVPATNLAKQGISELDSSQGILANLFGFYFPFYVYTRVTYDKNLCLNMSKKVLSNIQTRTSTQVSTYLTLPVSHLKDTLCLSAQVLLPGTDTCSVFVQAQPRKAEQLTSWEQPLSLGGQDLEIDNSGSHRKWTTLCLSSHCLQPDLILTLTWAFPLPGLLPRLLAPTSPRLALKPSALARHLDPSWDRCPSVPTL